MYEGVSEMVIKFLKSFKVPALMLISCSGELGDHPSSTAKSELVQSFQYTSDAIVPVMLSPVMEYHSGQPIIWIIPEGDNIETYLIWGEGKERLVNRVDVEYHADGFYIATLPIKREGQGYPF